MATPTFSGYEIIVSDASPKLNSGNRWTFGATQVSQSGNAKAIRFELDSMAIGMDFAVASFHYDRLSTKTAAYDLRRAYVNVKVDGDVVFFGLVTGQSEQGLRVNIRAEGAVNIVEDAPLYGVERDATTTGPNALAVFNQNNKKDKITGGGGELYLDDDDSQTPLFWTGTDMASFLAKQMENLLVTTNNSEDIFDFSTLQNELGSVVDPNEYGQDIQPRAGLISFLKESLDRTGQYAIFTPFASATLAGSGVEVGLTVSIQDRFDAGSKRAPTLDLATPANWGALPFNYSVSKDFNSPVKAYAISGQTYVMTTYQLALNGAYVAEEIEETGETKRLVFTQPDGRSANFFGSASNLVDDVVGLGKSRKVSDVLPRLTNFTELNAGTDREPLFEDDFRIYFNFDTTNTDASIPSNIMLNGEKWESLTDSPKDKDPDGILRGLDQLSYRVSPDRMQVAIEGFPTEDADGRLTIEKFKDAVLEIYIPVTLVIEQREIAGSERLTQTDISTVETDETASAEIDLEEFGYAIEFAEDYHPIVRLEDYDLTSEGSTIGFETDTDISWVDELKEVAKETLLDAVLNDGSSMTMSVPVEMFFDDTNLPPATFPKNLGNWLDKITGDGNFATVHLPRPMTLYQIEYDQSNVSLRFK